MFLYKGFLKAAIWKKKNEFILIGNMHGVG